MAHATKFDATALVTSPMVNTSLLLPRGLLDEIDRAATRDDPSSPNRSSWMRRALIDRLKEEVPIWKQENWADGTKEWVHPGTPSA